MSKSRNIALSKYLVRQTNPLAGRVIKPITKMQEKIAQKVYGKPFSELDSDTRVKIRQGRININSGGINMMSLQDRINYTKKRMQDFVSDFQKERGRLPSQQEVRKLGGFEFGTIKKYIKEGVVKVGEVGATRGLKDPRVLELNNDLKILDNNKYIQDSFRKSQVPNLNEVSKILNTNDKRTAAYRVGQLAATYTGDRKVEGIKPKFKKGAEFIFQQADAEYNPAIRRLSELKIGRSVDERSIASTKNVIKRQYPEGISETYAIDEPAGTISSARRGTSPYGAFGQIINADLNQGLKYEFDRKKSVLEKSLQEAIESGSDQDINKAVKKFNDNVSEYETRLNAGTKPGQKKIKLFKVSLDNPEKTISNYSGLSKEYKDAFQKNYKTRGYSFKIPSDIKPLSQMADELKIEKNVSKLSSAAAKGAPRIYSEALPGLRSAGEFIGSTIEDFASKRIGAGLLKTFGAAGVAYGIYDTGVAYNEGRSTPEMAARLIGVDPIYREIREFSRLTPEAQEVQKKVNQQMSFDAAVESPLDEGLMTLRPRPEVTEQEKLLLDQDKQRVKTEVEKEEQERRTVRGGYVDKMKQAILNITGTPYEMSFANGGRVQLSEGGKPKDLGRRKFVKGMLTIGAALPFLGPRLFKPMAKVGPEAVEAISRTADSIPTYLTDLISKVKMMGKSKLKGRPDDPEGFVEYELGDYKVTEGQNFTRVNHQKQEGEFLYDEIEMEIKKDPETGGLEYEEVTALPDQEGKLKDIDFGIDDDRHKILEKFAYEE